jgi:hypothetical protein
MSWIVTIHKPPDTRQPGWTRHKLTQMCQADITLKPSAALSMLHIKQSQLSDHLASGPLRTARNTPPPPAHPPGRAAPCWWHQWRWHAAHLPVLNYLVPPLAAQWHPAARWAAGLSMLRWLRATPSWCVDAKACACRPIKIHQICYVTDRSPCCCCSYIGGQCIHALLSAIPLGEAPSGLCAQPSGSTSLLSPPLLPGLACDFHLQGVTEKFLADTNPAKINLGVVSFKLPLLSSWQQQLPQLFGPGSGTARVAVTADSSASYLQTLHAVCILCAHSHAAAPAQGAYRDDAGRPVVLESVREAERRVAGSKFME